jgi:anti-anti-sigma regulatory factor
MGETGPIAALQYLPDATVVTVVAPMIMAEEDLQRLRDTVEPVITEKMDGNLILDFSEVRGISSSVIGYLVALKRRYDQYRGRMIICCVDNKIKNTPTDKFVYEIFKVVKLDRYFELSPSVEDAVGRLTKRAK